MLLADLSGFRIFIKPGHSDMRKGINGLALIVQERMSLDPIEHSIFLFCNKRRNLLKVLYWDDNGFWLWLKRLEKHRFPWPKDSTTSREISREQLQMILSGIDFFNAHEKLNYARVG